MSRSTRNTRSSRQTINDYDRPSTSSGLPRVLSQDSGQRQIAKKSTGGKAIISIRKALSQGSANFDSTEDKTRSIESENITLQGKRNLAVRVIRYLLIAEKKKHAIRKPYIMKHIAGITGKNFRDVMEIASSLLSKVFGYKLVDIGSDKYILINEIQNDLPHLNFEKSIKTQQVLLFIILAHIFMAGDSSREETLWDFLRQLGIIQEDNYQHDYFGDIQKLITVDFIAQHYLEKVLVDKGDNPKYEYKWGPRAEHEVSHRDVLNFVSKVYGNQPINSWKEQYKLMLLKEKSKEK